MGFALSGNEPAHEHKRGHSDNAVKQSVIGPEVMADEACSANGAFTVQKRMSYTPNNPDKCRCKQSPGLRQIHHLLFLGVRILTGGPQSTVYGWRPH